MENVISLFQKILLFQFITFGLVSGLVSKKDKKEQVDKSRITSQQPDVWENLENYTKVGIYIAALLLMIWGTFLFVKIKTDPDYTSQMTVVQKIVLTAFSICILTVAVFLIILCVYSVVRMIRISGGINEPFWDLPLDNTLYFMNFFLMFAGSTLFHSLLDWCIKTPGDWGYLATAVTFFSILFMYLFTVSCDAAFILKSMQTLFKKWNIRDIIEKALKYTGKNICHFKWTMFVLLKHIYQSNNIPKSVQYILTPFAFLLDVLFMILTMLMSCLKQSIFFSLSMLLITSIELGSLVQSLYSTWIISKNDFVLIRISAKIGFIFALAISYFCFKFNNLVSTNAIEVFEFVAIVFLLPISVTQIVDLKSGKNNNAEIERKE